MNIFQKRTCQRCGLEKEVTNFSNVKRIGRVCRECKIEKAKIDSQKYIADKREKRIQKRLELEKTKMPCEECKELVFPDSLQLSKNKIKICPSCSAKKNMNKIFDTAKNAKLNRDERTIVLRNEQSKTAEQKAYEAEMLQKAIEEKLKSMDSNG